MEILWIFLQLSILLSSISTITSYSFHSLIVGGVVIRKEICPFIVSVRFQDFHICGASILNETHVLTAAHCTQDGSISDYGVRSGADSADEGVFHKVVSFKIHPDYDERDYSSSDLATMQIDPPFKFSPQNMPIALARERPPDGSILRIYGWGNQKAGVETTKEDRSHLRMTAVRVVNQQQCAASYYRKKIFVTPIFICAAADGRDACQEDSGGPLVDKDNKKLVGVTLFGYGCARKDYPGVYASIPDLRCFIDGCP